MKKPLLLILMAVSMSAFAQKVKLVEGNLNPLKGEKVIKTEFDYTGMTIGTDGLSEADYIERKKGDYNKKEPGRGDQWEKSWSEDRTYRFEPRFNELFQKFAGVSVKGDSKYTLIFKTTRTEPGFNVGVMRRPARIDADVLIVETANHSNVLARLSVTNAPGRDAGGFDYDSGLRIQEAYAKSGKEIGKLIVNTLK